ncbi:MAG: TetR family transcriptional regulator [Rhodobacteraceae bacterium]|nr:TetR family transcriptional regulator [Paracoccaceae bacterium]
MPKDRAPTRIQKKNRKAILDSALDIFSARGFRGATVDDIASAAGLSKPNLLYYFPTKESIYLTLLEGQLDTWLDPLRALESDGDPLDQILAYVRRKLEMSQAYPRESRLFAHEIMQGAPRITDILSTDLRQLVDEKAALIQGWMEAGRLAPVHPHHLIFSIWSLTQHYADFDVQIRAVLPGEDPFAAAPDFVETLYRRLLTP